MINLSVITTIDILLTNTTHQLITCCNITDRGNLFEYNDNVWCLGRTSSIRRYDTLKEEIRHNHLHEVHYFFWFLFHVGYLLSIMNCIVIHLQLLKKLLKSFWFKVSFYIAPRILTNNESNYLEYFWYSINWWKSDIKWLETIFICVQYFLIETSARSNLSKQRCWAIDYTPFPVVLFKFLFSAHTIFNTS